MLWWVLLGLAAAEVIFVVEVSRHGSRSPIKFYSWDYDGRWPQGPGELTPLGMRQHYLIGYELRNRYVLQTPLLSPSFSAKEIYVRSTDLNRTLMSAYSQLRGLYPDGTGPTLHQLSLETSAVPPINITDLTAYEAETGTAALPRLKQAAPVHTTSTSTDMLLRSEDNCQLVESLMSTSNQEAFIVLCQKYRSAIQAVADYFNETFDNACKMARNVQGSLAANSFCGYPVPSSFSDPSIAADLEAYHAEYFDLQYRSPPIVGQLIATPYMTLLVETFTDAVSAATDLKFIFLSAHDTNIQGFISGLQLNTTVYPVYSSTLITELHRIDGDFFVKTLYNDIEVVVPDCTMSLCPLQTYLGYLKRRIVPNMQDVCSSVKSRSVMSGKVLVLIALISGVGVCLVLYCWIRRPKQPLLEAVAV